MQVFRVVERTAVKGPGKVVTLVATKEQAGEIVAALTVKNPTVKYVVGDEPYTVETPAEFFARQEVEAKAAEVRKNAMTKLTADELSALGIK